MNKKQKQKEKIQQLQTVLCECQKLLTLADRIIAEINGKTLEEEKEATVHFDQSPRLTGEEVIEGIFNGRDMVSEDGAKHPVPENYASKSKIVAGDRLKLVVTLEGRFVYKQIGPVERETVRGTLQYNSGEDQYSVLSEGKSYNVLAAPINYFKAEIGDEVFVIVPKGRDSLWAAVEKIIKSEGKDTERERVAGFSFSGLEEI